MVHNSIHPLLQHWPQYICRGGEVVVVSIYNHVWFALPTCGGSSFFSLHLSHSLTRLASFEFFRTWIFSAHATDHSTYTTHSGLLTCHGAKKKQLFIFSNVKCFRLEEYQPSATSKMSISDFFSIIFCKKSCIICMKKGNFDRKNLHVY